MTVVHHGQWTALFEQIRSQKHDPGWPARVFVVEWTGLDHAGLAEGAHFWILLILRMDLLHFESPNVCGKHVIEIT
jgi:hypothetical protein